VETFWGFWWKIKESFLKLGNKREMHIFMDEALSPVWESARYGKQSNWNLNYEKKLNDLYFERFESLGWYHKNELYQNFEKCKILVFVT
jgi:hypothetical protein